MVKKITALFAGIVFVFLFGIKPAFAATYTVTKTAETNDGTCDSDCSLREAVVAANANSGADTINFSIPTSDTNYTNPSGTTQGYFTITTTSALTLSDDSGVYINGYSQTGASRNTASFGQTLNTVLKIRLTTTTLAINLFNITGDNNHVSGLNIAPGNSSFDAVIDTSSNNWFEGNYSGTDITGTTSSIAGNIQLQNSSNNNIFGTNGDGSGDVGEFNIFQWDHGNNGAINSSDATITSLIVAGNYFGVNNTGRTCGIATMARHDILISGGSGHRIGTNYDGVSDSDESNIFACVNSQIRALMRFSSTVGGYFQGNYVGTNPQHDNLLSSFAEPGVIITSGTTGLTVKGNTIMYNGAIGVQVSINTTTHNTISGNIIASNVGMPIDIDATGINTNDVGDVDTGTNDQMNYPVIRDISYVGSNRFRVSGTIDGTASESPYTIEICLSENTPSSNGGCLNYLGSTTTSSNNWAVVVDGAGNNGSKCLTFTSLATNNVGSTSEYGLNSEYTGCRSGTSSQGNDASFVSSFAPGNIDKNNVLAITPVGAFKYNSIFSVVDTPKKAPFKLPGTNYWQVGSKLEIWWKSQSNGAKIMSSEVAKPFTLIFKYAASALEKSINENSLKLAYSADGKKWKIVQSILDTKKKELIIITKNGGYYMIVGGGQNLTSTRGVQGVDTQNLETLVNTPMPTSEEKTVESKKTLNNNVWNFVKSFFTSLFKKLKD